MTAYPIANYDITNKEGFQPYGAASVRTLKVTVANFWLPGSEARLLRGARTPSQL